MWFYKLLINLSKKDWIASEQSSSQRRVEDISRFRLREPVPAKAGNRAWRSRKLSSLMTSAPFCVASLITSLSLCFLLTACGFRPLYTPHQGCSTIAYPIKIATISNRDGQILRNYLVDLLTPEGTPAHPQYLLEIILTDVIRSIGVNKDETTSRSEAILTAAFILKDAKTNAIVYKHSAKAINSFSILNQNYYADLVAEEYAKKEATRLLAEKIMLLITTYIDTHE